MTIGQAVACVTEAFWAREDGTPRGPDEQTAAEFVRETIMPILAPFPPATQRTIVEKVIARGGLAPDEIEALKKEVA